MPQKSFNKRLQIRDLHCYADPSSHTSRAKASCWTLNKLITRQGLLESPTRCQLQTATRKHLSLLTMYI
eukprot:scaffold255975_cov17-Prasinocladus_malaysianus.AAC.1